MRKFRHIYDRKHHKMIDTHRRSVMRKIVKAAHGNIITIDCAYPTDVSRHTWDCHMRADAYLRLLHCYFIAYRYY